MPKDGNVKSDKRGNPRREEILAFNFSIHSLFSGITFNKVWFVFFSQYLLSTDTHIAKFSRISFNCNLRLFRKKTGVGLKCEIYFAILLSSFRKEEAKQFLEYEFKQDRNLSDDALV